MTKTEDPATQPATDPPTSGGDQAAQSGGAGQGGGSGSGGSGGAGGKHSDLPVSVVDVRSVTTNPEVDQQGSEQTVIVSGLQPGDVVVTAGMDKLAPNTKVYARITATSRPAGGDKGSAATRGSHGGHGKGGHHRAATAPSEDAE